MIVVRDKGMERGPRGHLPLFWPACPLPTYTIAPYPDPLQGAAPAPMPEAPGRKLLGTLTVNVTQGDGEPGV